MNLGNGLEFFREHVQPETVAALLETCTVWIDPECFKLLPVWSPFTYRKAPLYKANWSDRQSNKDIPKTEGNVAASKAQNQYLGLASTNKERPNWACCHLWGNDDPLYQSDHAEVNDPRYFTCPANMVLVPAPLKTFTDTVPEVKAALRYVAGRIYGFCPEGRDLPSVEDAGEFLPRTWQDTAPKTMIRISKVIRDRLYARATYLNELQSSAGPEYPRKMVTDTLRYWLDKCPECLFAKQEALTTGWQSKEVSA